MQIMQKLIQFVERFITIAKMPIYCNESLNYFLPYQRADKILTLYITAIMFVQMKYLIMSILAYEQFKESQLYFLMHCLGVHFFFQKLLVNSW